MMDQEVFLMTPGPVAIDSEILLAGAQPLKHHRTNDFAPLYAECVQLLKKFFHTTQHLYLTTSSGTGAMESALANLFHPGEKILTVETGAFGERFTQIARALKLEAIPLNYSWGKRARLEDIERMIEKHPDLKGITVTFNETSTGVCNDLEAIGKLLKGKDILFITDGVSGIGALPFKMDEWGLDCVVSASQKAFLAPPGVGMVAMSDRALAKAMRVECHGLYFDIKEYKKNQELAIPSYPWTPAISVMFSMHTALKRIERIGLDKMIKHFALLAKGLRAALTAMGLSIFTEPEAVSSVLTVINSPQGIQPSKIVERMRKDYGVLIACGQGKISDQVFRITTIGCIGEREIISTVGLLEIVLHQLGVVEKLGVGTTALLKEFCNFGSQDCSKCCCKG